MATVNPWRQKRRRARFFAMGYGIHGLSGLNGCSSHCCSDADNVSSKSNQYKSTQTVYPRPRTTDRWSVTSIRCANNVRYLSSKHLKTIGDVEIQERDLLSEQNEDTPYNGPLVRYLCSLRN